jgi:hypothetical protein
MRRSLKHRSRRGTEGSNLVPSSGESVSHTDQAAAAAWNSFCSGQERRTARHADDPSGAVICWFASALPPSMHCAAEFGITAAKGTARARELMSLVDTHDRVPAIARDTLLPSAKARTCSPRVSEALARVDAPREKLTGRGAGGGLSVCWHATAKAGRAKKAVSARASA